MSDCVAFRWTAAEVERFFFTTGHDSTTWSFGRISHDLSESPTLHRESNIGKDQFVEMSFVAVDSKGLLVHEKTSNRSVRFYPGRKAKSLDLKIEKFNCSENEFHQTVGTTLLCKMTVYCHHIFETKKYASVQGEQIKTSICAPISPKAEDFPSLTQDMNALLESGDFSDAVLCCRSKEVKVHKSILSSRSPVFAAMFLHQMKENIQNRVEISDIDEDILMRMLKYIYTGTVNDFDFNTIRNLYSAAEKYDIHGLKNICRRFLKHKIFLDNVTDMLLLSEMFNDRELKMYAVNFTTENFEQLRENASWESFLKEHQTLGLELLNAITNALISKKY